MSKNSGVDGKTVEQLRRSVAARARQDVRDARTPAEQLTLLDERPGQSLRERARLSKEN